MTPKLDMTGTPMARVGEPPTRKVRTTAAGVPVWSWRNVGVGMLPFADSATPELPLGRLLRLSMFQVTVGMAAVLLIGTLNRVMIVELGLPAWLVATMISLPLVFAPFRMLVGHRSDIHRSVLGWRRVPYIWFGTLMQFGGLAIMPFALILLSGDLHGPPIIGQMGAALAFLLAGAGLHMTPDRQAWPWPPTWRPPTRDQRSWRSCASCSWSAPWCRRCSSDFCSSHSASFG